MHLHYSRCMYVNGSGEDQHSGAGKSEYAPENGSNAHCSISPYCVIFFSKTSLVGRDYGFLQIDWVVVGVQFIALSFPYGSFCIVRRIVPTEEDGGRRRPKPNPPPRPTTSAASAITMVAQMGVPPLPELLEVVCPVVVAVAAGVEVGVAAAPELTVK